MELTAIKIKIGLKANGQADYPDLNIIQTVKDSGMDWSHYIDSEGIGWVYDKKYGHKEAVADSPRGMQWGVLLVPDAMALEAIAAFPALVTKITEVELTDFYDNRACEHLAEKEIDEVVMNNLKLELDYKTAALEDTTAIKAQMKKALDPDDSEPGVKRNQDKTWALKKIKEDITIKK